jgi:hypothetical protein
MKKCILLIVFVLAVCANAFAQPKTVTDFYLAMPNDVYSTNIEGKKITNKAALIKYRKSLIKVEDLKNGYLRLEGAWEGWAEIALFKRKDGSYLIAETSVGCGPVCDGGVKFSTYQNAKWTDVTKQFAPKITNQMTFEGFRKNGGVNEEVNSGEDLQFYYYLLPRIGRTLQIACNECSGEADDFVLLEYEWNGEKFVQK